MQVSSLQEEMKAQKDKLGATGPLHICFLHPYAHHTSFEGFLTMVLWSNTHY